ncbi:uncharacterized protein ARMOST_21470 [Armillaria ostoyae]|uniref:Peptidase C14 caspase domain-containing protein n=1 Tax=Armillaria ostoyae TaxID=47428 RepID=A0A284SA69_ARMOS|nr:uncharacterized protein ARMOST_21470 [Armillaria ostoyae]
MDAWDPSLDLGTDQKDVSLLPWWISGPFIILIILGSVNCVRYGHRHDYTLLDEEITPVIEREAVRQRAGMTGNRCIQADLDRLNEQIEKRKNQIAEKHGITGDLDHIDALDKVSRDENPEAAKDLTELHGYRLQYYRAWISFHDVHVEESSCPTIPVSRVNASRFWAVIIGIDKYQAITSLKCCVRDAKSFRDYLTADLGVPGERIQLLLDVPEPKPPKIIYPSRANIIATLVSLINNPEIKKGDNIIIYYAGHGSSYECSEYDGVDEISFASSGYIEALCPIDRDTDANGNTG